MFGPGRERRSDSRRHKPSGRRGERDLREQSFETAVERGEIILGHPAEVDFPIPLPKPEVLGRNGTYAVFRKLHIAWPRSGSFSSRMPTDPLPKSSSPPR